MRYEDIRRLRGVESFWFRLTMWLRPTPKCLKQPLIGNFSHLTDHERRDIGVPDQVRFADWRELKDRAGPF